MLRRLNLCPESKGNHIVTTGIQFKVKGLKTDLKSYLLKTCTRIKHMNLFAQLFINNIPAWVTDYHLLPDRSNHVVLSEVQVSAIVRHN